MPLRRWIPLTLAVVLVCAGCGTGHGGSSSTTTPSPGSGGTVQGTSWQLVSFAAPGTETLTKVPASVSATAEFTADRVSGSGGCNTFGGPYTVDGASIEIGPLVSTQMACPGQATSVEAAYLLRLGQASTFTATAKELTLLGPDGATLLTFSPARTPPLVGTRWTATGINNGKQAVDSVVSGSTVTAEFAAAGTVSGSGGCNTYNGPYTVDGTRLSVGALASTRKLCADDVNAQETAYFAALAAATTFTVRGDALELRDDSGALQVQYTSAPS